MRLDFSLPGWTRKTPAPVASVVQPADTTDADVQDEAKKKAQALRKRRGYGNTRLTQPGLGDVEAPVQRSTLLGRTAA